MGIRRKEKGSGQNRNAWDPDIALLVSDLLYFVNPINSELFLAGTLTFSCPE